jgi:hypothetical protein
MSHKQNRLRFQKVVTRRTNNALRSLRLLRKCFVSPRYEYTDDEARSILVAIDETVKRLHVAVQFTKEEFSLTDTESA